MKSKSQKRRWPQSTAIAATILRFEVVKMKSIYPRLGRIAGKNARKNLDRLKNLSLVYP